MDYAKYVSLQAYRFRVKADRNETYIGTFHFFLLSRFRSDSIIISHHIISAADLYVFLKYHIIGNIALLHTLMP